MKSVTLMTLATCESVVPSDGVPDGQHRGVVHTGDGERGGVGEAAIGG